MAGGGGSSGQNFYRIRVSYIPGHENHFLLGDLDHEGNVLVERRVGLLGEQEATEKSGVTLKAL